MSNNVVSHQFQFQDRQTVQMENVDSLTSDIQNQVVGHVSHNFSPFHMPISSDLGGTVESLTTYSGFPSLMVPKNQVMHMGTKPGTVGFAESGLMMPNIGQQSSLLPSKRKAEVEATSNSSISQQSSVVNKRAVQLGTSSNMTPALQSNQLNRKSVHSQSKFGPAIAQNTPSLNKKFMRNDSTSGKSSSQRVQTPKSRTVQVEPTSKARTESVGAVRSKMREKLAEALSLTSENQDKSSDAEKNITKTSTSGPGQGDSCPPGSDTGAIGVHEDHCQPPEGAPLVKSCPSGKSDHSQGLSAQVSNNGSLNNNVETCTDSHHFTVLPQQGVPYSDNFFVKDELLQGNGLSWALDFDMAVAEVREPSQVEEQQERLSPEKLASEIEVELFKLFGGVNKKYKEKGRSLCFNLKDPNNPELRERVMSGEISPERLCSMSAEELASKELSEWRMAKAEEFAQMVVLPDTDFDRRRRLVKKTHKGEYQVEMEEDSGDLMDVSSGTPLPLQNQTRGKETEASALSEVDDLKNKGKTDNRKSSSENNDHQGSLIIPSDGTDLMQGMIVDELKDAEFLPPIISLDEFMESLHSEPPFESLQAADARTVSEKEKEKSDVGNSSAAESEASKEDAPSERADQAFKARKVDVASKSSESPMVQKKVPTSDHSPRIRHFWEGTIQLTGSSTISTFSVFKSGEKTTTVEWPSSLDIKGRVRLDAFEKFIKELPMSRSRAVMILHFTLKDSESESDRANLLEAVDSYVSDKRLGFAEPATGVELYFCPANASMIDMLSSYLMKERGDIANSSDNGLIGVVVWRKAPVVSTNTISPNSSHNKHTSSMKRQQHLTSSRRHQEKDANVNMNAMSKGPSVYQNAKPPAPTLPADGNNDDDESDIPPGFGPAGATAAKDDDDLPEFNFSGNINPAISRPSSSSMSHIISRTAPFKGPPRPVEQMRQLVHKYGQTASADSSRPWLGNKGSGVGLGIKPWNDDDDDDDEDDDDIPEWRPLAPHQHQHQHQPPPPNHHGFRQPSHNPYVNQHFVPTVATHHHQLNGSTSTWQQGGGRWVQTSQVNPGNQSSGGGQYYRIPMVQAGQRQDVSRSRGF